MLKLPHGGEVLGAAPANPILAPVLSQDRGLRMSRQRELLDLQAIQRISGLVGYWKADPTYFYEDSVGTTLASTSGTGPVGAWNAVNGSYSLGAELNTSPTTWTTPAETTNNGDGSYTFSATTAARAIQITIGDYTGVFHISFTVSNYSSGYVNGIYHLTYLNPNFSGGGVCVSNVVISGTGSILYIQVPTGTTLTVSNISFKRVTTDTAYQVTTANKPILRKTPTTGVYWADSNTSTGALNVGLSDTVLGLRNLLTYSEDFSNAAWAKVGSVSVANNLMTATTTTACISKSGHALTAGSGYTLVVRAKYDNCSWLRLLVYETVASTNRNTAWVNIQTGAVGTVTNGGTGSGAAVSVTDVGDGSYDVKLSGIASAAGTSFSVQIAEVSSNGVNTCSIGDKMQLYRAQLESGSVATDYQKITNVPAYCTLARATAEGVTFTDNSEIAATYNIAPAFSFNSDVAIFNRSLTATEKALITRYMARAVPMLGSNVVTNGTFDTDTAWTKGTGWSIGSGIASKSAGTASNLTQSVGVSGNAYYAKADATVTAGTIGAYPGSGTTQFGSTSATGTLAYAMKASGTGIGVRGDASFAGNVDNATIKEIL